MNWPKAIVTMVLVKQALAEADVDEMWPHHIPEVAAQPERLAEAEASVGFTLDPLYADFLRYADGWNGFSQTVDLFGTAELIGNEKMQQALESFDAMEDVAFSAAGISRDDVYPIAATAEDIDIFLLGKPGTPIAGTVLWFAGAEVERYENFNEYFLATIDYVRDDLATLQKEHASVS